MVPPFASSLKLNVTMEEQNILMVFRMMETTFQSHFHKSFVAKTLIGLLDVVCKPFNFLGVEGFFECHCSH
jgi:hypothetical protein